LLLLLPQQPRPTLFPYTTLFRSLKPGGVLLLVDHSAKPGTGAADAGRIHRIDEEYARHDFEKYGFKYVSRSDVLRRPDDPRELIDRKSTRLNSSHLGISYAVFCL